MPQSNYERTIPLTIALKVLDIADANKWHYAPFGDGCFSRDEMERSLRDNPDSAFSLVINYKQDYADSIIVSLQDGNIKLELEDQFYYDGRTLGSLDELYGSAWQMLEKFNA
jgi:uncharacterized glyoxalase superfamily protein PhnB